MRVFILCAALLLALLPAGAQQLKWETVSSKPGRFTLQMPGTPKEQHQSVKTAVGVMDVHMFLVEQSNSAFIAGYNDYPAAAVQRADKQKILDGARDGAIRNVGGKLTGEQKVTLGGYPGRDFRFETRGMAGRCRVYIVNNRLYQVLVMTTQAGSTSPNVQKFLESFKLTK